MSRFEYLDDMPEHSDADDEDEISELREQWQRANATIRVRQAKIVSLEAIITLFFFTAKTHGFTHTSPRHFTAQGWVVGHREIRPLTNEHGSIVGSICADLLITPKGKLRELRFAHLHNQVRRYQHFSRRVSLTDYDVSDVLQRLKDNYPSYSWD